MGHSNSIGFHGFIDDAQQFLWAVTFARPSFLWLVLLLPIFAFFNWFATTRNKRALALLGRPGAIAGLLSPSRSPRRWFAPIYSIGWIALVIGIAGPRWGENEVAGVAVGRDIVIAIDLSQSMRADDMHSSEAPTRWQAARASVLNLLSNLGKRGGHRVAILIFAARPYVLTPLTTDYDHVMAVVEEIDGKILPPEVRPGGDPTILSGTRIGSALSAAVALHDPRFPKSQDILLLSDGDDPADDREWLKGIDAARQFNIPIYTVGLGSPENATQIVIGEQNPDLVLTKLEEAPLRQIALETGGQYLAAQQNIPRLADFFEKVIEPSTTRQLSDEALPQPKERYIWFLLPSLVLFGIAWFFGNLMR